MSTTQSASPNPAREYPGRELESMDFAENYHNWILDEIGPYLGENVAEVGAGLGSISKLLLKKKIKRLTAFEPSADLFRALAKTVQSDKRATAINDFFGVNYANPPFDSVVYLNVLEHIENDTLEISNAFRGLRPGGHLIVFVPALRGLYSDFDRRIGHFRRYSRDMLTERVRSGGFREIDVRYFDIAGIVPWYVNFVLLRNSMQGGAVALYDKLVVPVMKVVESFISPPIGKNLLLIAKKS